MNKYIELGKQYQANGDIDRALTCFAKVSGRDPDIFCALADCYEEGIGVNSNAAAAKKFLRLARRANKRQRDLRRRDARLMHQAARCGMSSVSRLPSKGRRVAYCMEACEARVKGFIAAKRIRRERRILSEFGNDIAKDVMVGVVGRELIKSGNWIDALAQTL